MFLIVLPAASSLPADNNKAGADADLEVLVVTIFLDIVKSPVVLMLMAPVALIPLYVVAPEVIEPIVKSPVLTMVSVPTPEPDAMVRSALLVLDKLIALLPINIKP